MEKKKVACKICGYVLSADTYDELSRKHIKHIKRCKGGKKDER